MQNVAPAGTRRLTWCRTGRSGVYANETERSTRSRFGPSRADAPGRSGTNSSQARISASRERLADAFPNAALSRASARIGAYRLATYETATTSMPRVIRPDIVWVTPTHRTSADPIATVRSAAGWYRAFSSTTAIPDMAVVLLRLPNVSWVAGSAPNPWIRLMFRMDSLTPAASRPS